MHSECVHAGVRVHVSMFLTTCLCPPPGDGQFTSQTSARLDLSERPTSAIPYITLEIRLTFQSLSVLICRTGKYYSPQRATASITAENFHEMFSSIPRT